MDGLILLSVKKIFSSFCFGIFKTAIIQKVNISTNDLVMIFQMQKDEDPTFFVTV